MSLSGRDTLFGSVQSLAVIMDGNGRWAKGRGLPRTSGHIAGAKIVRPTLEIFKKYGVRYVTLYAFSSENFKRPKEEVDAIMKLIFSYLDTVAIPLIKKDKSFAIRFIGDLSGVPKKLKDKCLEIEKMADTPSFICNVALNYGGRAEIVNAVNSAISDGVTVFSEKILSDYTYTKDIPDPDLIIRTGGENRLSNFLLWQCAYSELVVLDTLWPDFKEEDFIYSLKTFTRRQRRFGGLNKEDALKYHEI